MSLKPIISLATHRSDEYYRKIMRDLEERFACSPEVRTKASTPLAPPPADTQWTPKVKTAGRTESPTTRARDGFILDGMALRNQGLREKRRKQFADRETCPHSSGWWKSGADNYGRVRLKCRKCGKRCNFTVAEANR